MTPVLLGPSDADHFRTKVGRYGDRWYHDPLPACELADATDAVWPSISTVKKASGQDWTFVGLKRVAAKLALFGPDALVNAEANVLYEQFKIWNTAGLRKAQQRGTDVHKAAEALLDGHAVDTTFMVDDALAYLPALQAWFDAYQPELFAREIVCIHRDLHGVGYGGTADAFVVIDGKRYVLDWKTRSEDSDHGAYPEEAAQVAALAGAQYAIATIDGEPRRIKVPSVDGGLIVSIKPDGCRTYPVEVGVGA